MNFYSRNLANKALVVKGGGKGRPDNLRSAESRSSHGSKSPVAGHARERGRERGWRTRTKGPEVGEGEGRCAPRGPAAHLRSRRDLSADPNDPNDPTDPPVLFDELRAQGQRASRALYSAASP
jgi:hypothetical protein